MSKIIFEFDRVDDKEDIEIYSNAMKMYCVLTDLQDEFRQKIKYEKHNKTDVYWSDRLQALLDERDVRL